MPLPAVSAFEVPPLTSRFAPNAAPPLVLKAQKNWAVLLAALFRASCQQTAMSPLVWSSAIRGRNWLFVVASAFTRTGALHVAPLLIDVRTRMSVSLLSSGISCVYTRYNLPLNVPPLRSQARPASESTERED